MSLRARLVPELTRALEQRGIVVAVPLSLPPPTPSQPGLPAASLRAMLSLDGDLLLMVETGRARGEARLGTAEVCRLLSAQAPALAASMAALEAELARRERALERELRRLGTWLLLPQGVAVAAGLLPALAGLARGSLPALLDLALSAASGLGGAALLHLVLRALVRRAGRRMLAGLA